MAITLQSLRRAHVSKPPIMILHAVGGVGKTTLAASAPNPAFIQTEEGLRYPVMSFGLLKTWDDVFDAIQSLYTEDHNYQTLVVDSVDWLEPLVWKETCKRNKWQSIEDPGYGKGYAEAMTIWAEYIEGITALRDDRNMTIIQIAHTDTKRFDSPELEPYDRFVIKMQAKAAAKLVEHADIVAFENYRVSTVKTEVGFKKTVTRGVGGGSRVVYLEERPAFIAKNRLGLPEFVDLPDVKGNDPALWQALAQHFPQPAPEPEPTQEKEAA